MDVDPEQLYAVSENVQEAAPDFLSAHETAASEVAISGDRWGNAFSSRYSEGLDGLQRAVRLNSEALAEYGEGLRRDTDLIVEVDQGNASSFNALLRDQFR